MARDKEIAPLVIFFAERTGAFPSKMWWKSGPVVEKQSCVGKPVMWWKSGPVVENKSCVGKSKPVMWWKSGPVLENQYCGGKVVLWWKTR